MGDIVRREADSFEVYERVIEMVGSSKKPISIVALALFCVIFLTYPLTTHSKSDSVNSHRIGDVFASSGEDFQSRFGAASSQLPLWDTGQMDSQLDAMQSAGIAWVRAGIMWCDMEPIQGIWLLNGADHAINEAYSKGINVIGILGGPPGWANGTNPTDPFYPPTNIAAWQNYVTTVCTRYKGKVQAWEIWNEENIGFWKPSPNPVNYVTLLSQTTPYIKAADPAATVVMGGVAGLGSDYLNNALKAGAAEYVDAIAYHPYTWTLTGNNYTPQEVYCRQLLNWVRGLISQYTTKDIGIWLTELGWTTCTAVPPGVDENTQAAYLLRTFISYATTEADRVIWYNLWNQANDPADQESNWGLLNNDFSKKPSYKYYKCFTDALGDCTGVMSNVLSNISCSNSSTLELYAFEKPDNSVIVTAWKTNDTNDTLTFTLNAGELADPVSIDPLTGGVSTVSGVSRSNGAITVNGLATGKTPVILRFDTAENPIPHIDSLGNNSKTAGDPAFTLTVNGTGFVSDSVVEWDGSARTTHYSSSTKITADIATVDISKIGTHNVTIANPPPGGGTSNSVKFTVDSWLTSLIKQFWAAWYQFIKFFQWMFNPFGL